jgi:hypothetical protein
VLTLFGLGIVLGGQDALRPLGIPASGVWERLAQLTALFLIVAAWSSLLYQWKWPRGGKQASDVKTDVTSRGHAMRPEHGNVSPTIASGASIGFPWSAFCIGLGVLLAFLGLIGFVMYWTGSAWPLLGLMLPWALLGFMAGAEELDESFKRMLPATIANLGVTFAAGAALVAYGIVLADSAEPLWIIMASLVAALVGGGIAHEVAQDMKKDQQAVAAKVEQDGPSKGEELVKTPALLMKVEGGILTYWLMMGISGISAEGFRYLYFAPCVTGPAILIAGLAMGKLRFYWLAVIGSLLCFPATMFPFWGWFALSIGVFSLWRLMQPEVREAFRHRARRSESPSNEASDEPPPREILGRAWDDWWAERDQWLTWGVQSVLGIGFFVCLILYLSSYSSSERLPATDGQRLRHTIVTIGVPDPWFKWETYPDGRSPFQWRIDLISTSAGIMLLGFLGWCVNWQIEKAKAKATGKQLRWWHGSPNFGFAIWGVFTLVAIVMGIAAAELPQWLDRRSANLDTRPSEQKPEQNDGEAAATPADVSQATLELFDAAGRGDASGFPRQLASRYDTRQSPLASRTRGLSGKRSQSSESRSAGGST